MRPKSTLCALPLLIAVSAFAQPASQPQGVATSQASHEAFLLERHAGKITADEARKLAAFEREFRQDPEVQALDLKVREAMRALMERRNAALEKRPDVKEIVAKTAPARGRASPPAKKD